MEIIKNRLSHFGAVRWSGDVTEESQTVIIPDVSPDVLQILCARGSVYVQEKSCEHGELKLSGSVGCEVCYLSTEGREPCRVSASVPFSLIRPIEGMEDGDRALCAVRLTGVGASAVNPRKLSVRVTLQDVVRLFRREACSYVAELRPEDGERVFCRMKEEKRRLIVEVCEKKLALTDELRLGPDAPDESCAILSQQTEWIAEDVRVLPGKLMLRGRVDVSAAVMDARGVYCGRHRWSVPFSQLVESDALLPGDEAAVTFSPVREDLTLRTGADGVTTLTFSLAAVSEFVVRRETAIGAVGDVFSIAWAMNCERTALTVPASQQETVAVQLEETVRLDERPERIEDAIPLGGGALLRAGAAEIGAPCVLRLVCRAQDDTLSVCERRLTVTGALKEPLKQDAWCEAVCGEPNAAPGEDGAVTVRCEVRLCCRGAAGESMALLSDCALDRDRPLARRRDASLLLRRVEAETSVWDLARSSGASPERLAAANGVPAGGSLPAGRLALIPISDR